VRRQRDLLVPQPLVSFPSGRVVDVRIGGHFATASLDRPGFSGLDQQGSQPLAAPIRLDVPALDVADAAGLAALRGQTDRDLKEADRIKPEITSSQVIRNISDYHSQLINRTRHGDMIIPGETLYVLECAPAGYAAIAANEAEKAANIRVLEVRAFGSFGRVYLGGEEKDIDVAWRAAEEALKTITGRPAGRRE